MAEEVDFSPTPLDLIFQSGDDQRVRFTFGASIVGWSDWLVRIKDGHGTTWDATIDATNQATGVIVATVTHTQTAAIPSRSRWKFKALDALGNIRTLFDGVVIIEAEKA